MGSYILTVTINPAVDKVIKMKHFTVGSEQHSKDIYLSAGGKGINVSQALKNLGTNTYATGFLGGHSGEFIRTALNNQDIQHTFINIQGETRTSLTVIDGTRNQLTRILEEGPTVSQLDAQVFIKKFKALLKGCSYVVIAGRIVPGIQTGFYGDLIGLANKQNRKVVLDTSGKALAAGIHAKPYMIKPNLHEAEVILKKKLNSVTKLRSAISQLHKKGAEVVFISLGRKGAVASDGEECWEAVPPKIKPINTVGCGDALIAGYLYSLQGGSRFKKAVQFAVATGTANMLNLHPGMVSKKRVESIVRRVKLSPI